MAVHLSRIHRVLTHTTPSLAPLRFAPLPLLAPLRTPFPCSLRFARLRPPHSLRSQAKNAALEAGTNAKAAEASVISTRGKEADPTSSKVGAAEAAQVAAMRAETGATSEVGKLTEKKEKLDAAVEEAEDKLEELRDDERQASLDLLGSMQMAAHDRKARGLANSNQRLAGNLTEAMEAALAANRSAIEGGVNGTNATSTPPSETDEEKAVSEAGDQARVEKTALAMYSVGKEKDPLKRAMAMAKALNESENMEKEREVGVARKAKESKAIAALAASGNATLEAVAMVTTPLNETDEGSQVKAQAARGAASDIGKVSERGGEERGGEERGKGKGKGNGEKGKGKEKRERGKGKGKEEEKGRDEKR